MKPSTREHLKWGLFFVEQRADVLVSGPLLNWYICQLQLAIWMAFESQSTVSLTLLLLSLKLAKAQWNSDLSSVVDRNFALGPMRFFEPSPTLDPLNLLLLALDPFATRWSSISNVFEIS